MVFKEWCVYAVETGCTVAAGEGFTLHMKPSLPSGAALAWKRALGTFFFWHHSVRIVLGCFCVTRMGVAAVADLSGSVACLGAAALVSAGVETAAEREIST